MLGLIALSGALLPASAFAEGGKTIATAPPVVYGQQEFGNTATGQEYPGKGCGLLGIGKYYDEFWIVNATAGDVLTINWSGANGTTLRLYPAGTTDYTVFGETNSPAAEQELNPNGSSQLIYTVPVSGVMPLEFAVCDELSGEPPGPYNFTATAQHGLSVNLPPRSYINTNSVINGSAALSSAPAPSGMAFTLTATWPKGSASYTATSVGGGLSFQLALPEETVGQTVTLALSRPADSEYVAPKTVEIQTKVARPKPELAPPAPVTHHHKPLQCHKGYKKRRVRGKARCMRVGHHHHHRHHRR
ncbi:MAG: hypothetical protein JSS68_11690 [Actinobacteria bacterium]|nr:hypothetical protein [Actinomycetota bacterium]